MEFKIYVTLYIDILIHLFIISIDFFIWYSKVFLIFIRGLAVDHLMKQTGVQEIKVYMCIPVLLISR